jgi:hypothetical protein
MRGRRHAAIILELLRAIVDADACPLEDIFVIGALIYVLEPPPPAYVIDKQSRKVCHFIFHV